MLVRMDSLCLFVILAFVWKLASCQYMSFYSMSRPYSMGGGRGYPYASSPWNSGSYGGGRNQMYRPPPRLPQHQNYRPGSYSSSYSSYFSPSHANGGSSFNFFSTHNPYPSQPHPFIEPPRPVHPPRPSPASWSSEDNANTPGTWGSGNHNQPTTYPSHVFEVNLQDLQSLWSLLKPHFRPVPTVLPPTTTTTTTTSKPTTTTRPPPPLPPPPPTSTPRPTPTSTQSSNIPLFYEYGNTGFLYTIHKCRFFIMDKGLPIEPQLDPETGRFYLHMQPPLKPPNDKEYIIYINPENGFPEGGQSLPNGQKLPSTNGQPCQDDGKTDRRNK